MAHCQFWASTARRSADCPQATRKALRFAQHVARVGAVLSFPFVSWVAAQAQVVISDTAFWQLAVYSNAAGIVTVNPVPAGTRNVTTDTTSLVVSPTKVAGVHIYSGTSYSPASSGPIDTITLQVDVLCVTSCNGMTDQYFGLALRQDGKDYVTCNNATFSAVGFYAGIPGSPPPTGWKVGVTGAYNASDFCLVSLATFSAPGPIFFDIGQKPDLTATGSPVRCGLYTYSIFDLADPNNSGGGPQAARYDNWSCTIQPVGQTTSTTYCRSPSIPNDAGTACACPVGTIPTGCIRPNVRPK